MVRVVKEAAEVYGKGLEDSLVFYNPWWTGGIPPYLVKKYRRDVFYRIRGYLDIDRIIVIKGPRRVGKTTLMYQLIEDLLGGVPANRVIYVPFDDVLVRDFEAVIDYFERRVLKESLGGDPVYIFLDEAQFLSGWEGHVKKYFDRNYPVKFIVSGSSATLIGRQTESLMGRTVEETVLPFPFKDFLQYRLGERVEIPEGDGMGLKKYEKDARIAFEEYVFKGGLPNIFDIAETGLWQKLVKEDVINKALYRDIAALHDINRPEALEKLFLYLAGINGQMMDLSNISRSLGISREYAGRYVQYLKNAYLLIGVKRYARSVEKTVRASEKTYVTDPGIVNAVLSRARIDDEDLGHTVESIIAAHLHATEHYYWRGKREVDFIVETPDGALPIEVKYKNTIRKSDLEGVLEFMEKNGVKKGIVVTRDLAGAKETDAGCIRYVPAWRFLLEEIGF